MRRKYYLFLLLFILCFNVFFNYQILEKSSFARLDDEAWVVMEGLRYYRLIFLDPSINFMHKLDQISELHGQCHPPFFKLAESLSWEFLSLFKSVDIDLMILITNAMFFIILSLSIYGIGLILYNKNVGVLSVALVSMFPLVFGHSRIAMLDYPLMCLISLGLYLLLKTDKFRYTFYSILAGIVFGLAQLTKETAFVFMLGPGIYYFIKSYALNNRKQVLSNIVLALAAFLILSGMVYLRPDNLSAFKIYFGKAVNVKNHPDVFFYLKSFMAIVGPFSLVAVFPLLVRHLMNIKKRDKMLLFWFAVPFIFYSVFPNRTIRFLLPALPPLALIVSSEIDNINFSKITKKAIFIVLVLTLMLQYAFFNLGILNIKVSGPYFEAGVLSVRKVEDSASSKQLMDVFSKEVKDDNRLEKGGVLFLFYDPNILWPFFLNIYLHKLPFGVNCPVNTDEAEVIDIHNADWNKVILRSGYIIDKSGVKFINDCAKHISEGLDKSFIKYRDQFKLIASIKMSSEDATISVYKKIHQ